MKKLFNILCTVLIAAAWVLPLSAQVETLPEVVSEDEGLVEVFQEDSETASSKVYLTDEAGLLSSSQASALEEKLKSISQLYQSDVVIVTKQNIAGGNVTAYADDFFDSNGYGYGNERNGILFLITMQERGWAISTCGYEAITIFSDWRQNQITQKMLPYLREGDYAAAFTSFVKDVSFYLSKGVPTDETLTQEEEGSVSGERGLLDPVWAFISGFIGLISSWIGSSAKRSKYRTVAEQYSASGYEKLASATSRSGDYFVRTTTSKTLRQSSTPRTSYGGGFSHSSTHSSSSGSTHGGSHGSF